MKTITEYIENYLCVCKPILESNGLYNGCQEMAEYIVKESRKFKYDSSKEFLDNILTIDTSSCKFPNVFFTQCTIYFCNNDELGNAAGLYSMGGTTQEYRCKHIDSDIAFKLIKKYPKLKHIINKNFKFTNVSFLILADIIDCKRFTEKEYISIFSHELTHAYNDFCAQLNGIDIFSKEAMAEYNSANDYLSDEDQDNDIMHDIIYFFDKSEINAFVAGAVSAFLQHKDEIKTQEDLSKFCNKDQTIQHYRRVCEKIWYMAQIKDKEKQDKIVDAYNKHFKTNKTFTNICKDVFQKYNKIAIKLNKVFGKLYLDCLNKNIIKPKTVLYELEKTDLTGGNFEKLLKDIQG